MECDKGDLLWSFFFFVLSSSLSHSKHTHSSHERQLTMVYLWGILCTACRHTVVSDWRLVIFVSCSASLISSLVYIYSNNACICLWNIFFLLLLAGMWQRCLHSMRPRTSFHFRARTRMTSISKFLISVKDHISVWHTWLVSDLTITA